MESTQTSSDRHAASALLGEILRYAQNDDKNGGRTFAQPSRQLLSVRARLQPCQKKRFRHPSACAFRAQAFVTAEHDSPAQATQLSAFLGSRSFSSDIKNRAKRLPFARPFRASLRRPPARFSRSDVFARWALGPSPIDTFHVRIYATRTATRRVLVSRGLNRN